MVGNAAAALHGAPVTTVDIDFMFRKTPANLKKLKAVAQTLGAVILKPYYPVSDPLSRDQRRAGPPTRLHVAAAWNQVIRGPAFSIRTGAIWRTLAEGCESG